MCGRYYRRSDKQRIAEAYRLGEIPFDLVLPDWDFNVTPTTFQPVIRANRENSERELVLMRWGLVPFFTGQLSDVKGISTINAKAETVEKSPTWRIPFQKRRCLVIADGFYEWKRLERPVSHSPSGCAMSLRLPLPGCGTHGKRLTAAGFSPTAS